MTVNKTGKPTEKGNFAINKKWTAPTDNTMYHCVDCKAKGIKHKIIEQAGPPAPGNEFSYKGDPTTILVCTGCNKYDGPWVPAPY